MRFRLLLPIALFLLLPCFLAAQGSGAAPSFGVLAGTVTDASGNPYGGAVIEVLRTSPRLGSYARNDGSYRVIRLRPGTYKVLAKVPPYSLKDTLTVTIVAGVTSRLDIKVDPAALARLDDRRDTRSDRKRTARGSRRKDGGYDEGMGIAVAPSDAAATTADVAASSAPPVVARSVDGEITLHSFTAEGEGRSALVPLSSSSATLSRRAATTASGAGASVPSAPMFSESIEAGSASISKEKAASGEPTASTPSDDDDIIKPIEQPRQAPGQLTAGEWSDLENWPYWLDVTADQSWKGMLTHWGCDPASRVTVRLVDGQRAVIDMPVRLVDGQGKVLWNARTDNRGRAELFAGTNGAKGEYRLEVKMRGSFMSAGMVTSGTTAPYIIKLAGAATQRDEFDLMFVVDATGSMGDEMNYIKAELESVIDRNREASGGDLRLRLSCNFYRDEGDEYLVRPFPFNESTFEMIGHMREQVADGGGDTPEAVEDALEDAIEKHDWSPSARARLLFLVLDAPPHYTPERCARIRTLMARAAEKGIRIIPIASSGIDKETEFLLRLLDIYTGGTYLFLTDDSGIGNSHLKPTVGHYNVEFLNDLMVKVMARYLAVDELSTSEGAGMELR